MLGTEETMTGTFQKFDRHRSAGLSVSHALILCRAVHDWVSYQSPQVVVEIARVKIATPQNVPLLGKFWEKCAEYGINLTVEEQILLFQKFINS